MLSSLNTELKLVDRGTPEEPEPIDVIPNVRTATDTLFFHYTMTGLLSCARALFVHVQYLNMYTTVQFYNSTVLVIPILCFR